MSNRDKSLLFGLVIIIVILIYYFVPYKMLNATQENLEAEVTQLNTTYTVLLEDINKEVMYRHEIESFDKDNEVIATMLPQELSQEWLIYIVNDMEAVLEIDIPSYTIGSESSISYLNEDNTIEGQEFGIKNTISTNIICTYDQLKALLNYVNNNENRIVLQDLAIQSNGDTGDLNVAFSLDFYGLNIEGRGPEQFDLGDFDIGKESVFSGFDGYSTGDAVSPDIGSTKLQEGKSDFYILLEPISSDRTTAKIARSDDPANDTAVYYDENSVTNIELIFTQSDGVYYYKYKAGEDTYPNDYASAIAFDPGLALEVQIFSEDRVDTTDLSGVNASIFNYTDMPVNIVYYKEDFENPRFTLGYTEGEVIVH